MVPCRIETVFFAICGRDCGSDSDELEYDVHAAYIKAMRQIAHVKSDLEKKWCFAPRA